MIQLPENQNKENDHFAKVLEPHLQDFKSKNNEKSEPNTSDDRKTSSYESCRQLLNDSEECCRIPNRGDDSL